MNDIEALHKFAFEVDQAAAAIPRRAHLRLECAVPPRHQDRFRVLLSPTARRIATVVDPGQGKPFAWRTVPADTEGRDQLRRERQVSSFRRLSAKWFGVTRLSEQPQAKPAPVVVDPYALLPIDLSKLPLPRIPRDDIEFYVAEGAAALGVQGAGGFEGGSSPNPAETFPMHLAMRLRISSVERYRAAEVLWRQLPTWWQDALTAYYSTARLAPKLARTREDKAAHKRANALQSMLDAARREKVALWLRSIKSPLDPDRVTVDAHKLWEWHRRERSRRWAEGDEGVVC